MDNLISITTTAITAIFNKASKLAKACHYDYECVIFAGI